VLMKLKAVQDDLSWAAYYEEVKDKETKWLVMNLLVIDSVKTK
jgi:hypothetical protein